jgi:predicted PurR-regulated permease PerM
MSNQQDDNLSAEKKTIDLSIKLIFILLLITWSAMIIFPFVVPILWGAILAITLFPMYRGLLKLVKGKKAVASSIITILLLCILLIPSILMISSIVNELRALKTGLDNHTLVIPAPNAKVAKWPLVGQKIFDAWSLLNTNLESALETYHAQILSVGQKLVSSMKGVFSNIMMFTGSIIISGIFMAYSEESQKSTGAFARRLVGNKADEFSMVVAQTIRNVSKGILGVAFIQFIIMGVCFLLAGVPFAGLWALVVFLLALVQLPGAIVAIPVIVYLYSVREPLPATLWAIVILICGLSDNVLKPLLMGKGAPVPMLVIFLGALGGFMLSGFIGLFTGAIVLSLAYKLAGLWIHQNDGKNELPANS